jgi:hypothetical protein
LLLLGLSFARGAFGWTLGGNATLLHQGRVWPAAHLLGAAFAGVAIVKVYRWMKGRSQTLAVTAMALLVVTAGASPVLASRRLTEIVSQGDDGFIYGGSDLLPGSFARNAAEVLGPDDIVRVEGSDRLAFMLFQFSGVRLAAFDDPRFEHNDLRIRYRDLAREWDAQIAHGGFEANWLVVPNANPNRSGTVTTGEFDGQTWSLINVAPEG